MNDWLNGDFYKEAFSNKEMELISIVNASDDSNNNNSNKVILLSHEDVIKYSSTIDLMKCVPTKYAISQGVEIDKNEVLNDESTCDWWIQSPADNDIYGTYVNSSGQVRSYGSIFASSDLGVRPAMWISLDA